MNAVDHNNVVIFDDRGIPSIMCRFVRPKDTEEVPAVFKIGDKVADAIYISKYPNIVIDGRAYSMPMADPTVNITFDGAVQACRCKGLGWHLMTAVEYEYLLNQSREKGTMPHGNTDWGKDYYHNDEQGKVSNLERTYTGTGPVTWNHDHTPYGVSDLNGNVWEWLAGLRIAIDQGGGKSQCGITTELSPTLTCTHGGEPVIYSEKRNVIPLRDEVTRNKASNGLGVGKVGGPCPTLTTADIHSVFYEAYQHHGYRESDTSGTLTAGQNNTVRGDTPLIVTDKKAFEENQHGGYRETQINGTLRAAGGVLRRRVGNSDNREYQDKGEYP